MNISSMVESDFIFPHDYVVEEFGEPAAASATVDVQSTRSKSMVMEQFCTTAR